MIKIKISSNFPQWPLLRQTPSSRGIWGECSFHVNNDLDECDYWIVIENLVAKQTTRCPKQNTILITQEPPAIIEYDRDFLMQFSTVITCRSSIKHPRVLFNQQGLPWMVGGKFNSVTKSWDFRAFTKDYDELKSISAPSKRKLLSVILSSKSMTEDHVRRLALVEKLKTYFGNDMDVFGVGMGELPDKWDGIADYQYHLALENSAVADYWTEKISDALLGWSYPFYYGCPNIDDYFSPISLSVINIHDPDAALSVIRKQIRGDTYEKSLNAIDQARQLVLDEHNIFSLVSRLTEYDNAKSFEEITLLPQNAAKKYRRTLWSILKGYELREII